MMKIYDAIVIGSGAAGYCAADRLFENGITNIAVITESRLSGTSRNTGSDKQTYYKISMDGHSADSAYKMAEDICSLGSCDGIKAYKQALNSTECFLRLCRYGVNFPKDEFGGYPGYKTDHDNTTRATSAGPLTSKMMTYALERRVLEHNKTPLLDNRQVIEIIVRNGRVHGVAVLNNETDSIEIIASKTVVAATGAPACIYKNSVYPHSQHGMTGVLINSGVKLCNFTQWQYGPASVDFRWNVSGSFMQVIPRFVSIDENGTENEFLLDCFPSAKEALDNVFLKGYQWPFCYDKILYSSGIDIAVHKETAKGNTVYLDFTKNPAGYDFNALSDEAKYYLSANNAVAETPVERLKILNAKAIDVYSRQGIDLYTEKLKISVSAQHNNGGVDTDENYQSCINGLYVIGEAAGSFGLTRPGGSALNDTQVGGLVCAEHIKNHPAAMPDVHALEDAKKRLSRLISGFCVSESIDYGFIPDKMSRCASFIRKKEDCEALLEEINIILSNLPLSNKTLSKYFYDKDMLTASKALLEAILSEMPLTGSRGGSIFTVNGKIIEENTEYRKYLSITGSNGISFRDVSPVPYPKKTFEMYLNKINEVQY
ncbi:MAG: FAD-binding protein [Clostridia bacterium]|nr:FAD-binding protein [Clostridia bacterium]